MLDMIFTKKNGEYTTNFIIACDSYKVGQHAQYRSDMEYVHSNIVPRKAYEGDAGVIDKVVVMGPQIVAFILSSVQITPEMIDEAELEITEQGYDFPRANWEYIMKLGHIPLHLRALPEGSVVQIGLPLMTVENTDPKCGWLVSYIESWAQDIVWVMTTIASKLKPLREKMDKFCTDTGTDPAHAEYMVHNFGDRGAGGQDRVIMAAMAHAVFFSGSDCLRANRYIKAFYGAMGPVLSSVDASEHSTMCANSDLATKNDYGAFEMTLGMLERAVDRANRGVGIPLISAVIDTYDDERYVKDFVLGNYDRICDIGGKYVCRPDTGIATEKPIEVANWLYDGLEENNFNEKGYRILPDNLGVMQGDGLREPDFDEIITNTIDNNLAASCFAFGFGGGMTNGSGRDDFSFSMKATSQKLAGGDWQDMQKMPKSDLKKTSLRGRVTVYRLDDGSFMAERVGLDEINPMLEDYMVSVYQPGSLHWFDFDEVRAAARA